ncbi:secologanin synthase-like [Andrographis paniculata]|uniref:secologanin synthase-like n=1 Tax=Andrographis paniculata TaxID=175694 RepID=UPI0021E8EBFA|nr:secologanin synthase-like [Andrographis paniculata]
MLEVMIISAAAVAVTAAAVWLWQFLDWAWRRPRKIEAMFRAQGMKGNSYKFLVGDSNDTARMYRKAFSKPIRIVDDIVPRVMPNIHQALHQHGDFCFTWAGPRPRVFIMDPDIARDVLSKRQVYLKPFTANNKTLQMLVTGLAIFEGEQWSKSRSRVNPVFKLNKLWSIVPRIQICGEETMKVLRASVAKGGGSAEVDICPHTAIVTSGVLARLMFNCPYTDEIKETFRRLDELAELASLHAKIWSFPGEKYFPTKTNRRANAIDKYVRGIFTTMINKRLKDRKPEDVESGYKDLLDVFLEELYEGKFSEKERGRLMEEVIAELRIFFFAGFETTSNLLTWSLVLLAHHHECQDRAREEVLQMLGDKKEITSDDVSKLKYITNVVNEALRLYSPGMEISRLVGEDISIKGFKIPKDTLLTFPILMYHRNTKYWGEDAGEFKPDRFSDGMMKATGGENVFFPFGWGPRICIGMNLSLIESKVMLAMLLREFSFDPSPSYVHAPCVAFTVHPQFGAPLLLKKL